MNRVVVAVAAFSIVLVRLPVLAGGGSIRLLGLLPFVGAIIWMRGRPQRAGASRSALLWIFVAITALSVYRGQKAGVLGSTDEMITAVLTLGTITMFALTLISSAAPEEGAGRMAAVALSPAVYLAVNIILQAGGVRAPILFVSGGGGLANGDQAELLRYLGITATRTEFPLSTGINSTGAVAAAGLAAALLLALYAKHLVPRWSALIAAAVSLYGVLAIDSRGALLFALALVGIFAVWRRANLTWIAFVIPLSPLVILGGLHALAATGLASGFSRANEDLGSGNNRLYIWEPIWNFVSRPTAELLYGFGGKGHITSGVSANYAYLFSGSDANPYAYSSHNIALQTLLDTGYVGLIVLIAMLFVSLRALRGIDHPIALALSAITLVVFLSGMTEALPNVLFLDTMVLTLMVTGVALGYRQPVMAEESAPSWASPPRAQLGDRVAAEGA